MKNAIAFTGAGGQGVISMGIILADSAVEHGKYASYVPRYGSEQRGGNAKCCVIIDDNEVVSPMVSKYGILIAMNQPSYNTFLPELEEGGVLIYNSSQVKPSETRDDVTFIAVPADDIAEELGSPKVANVIMSGALLGVTGLIDPEDFSKSLDRKFASKGEKACMLNREALKRGVELARRHTI